MSHELLDTSVLIEGRRGLTTILNIVEYPPAVRECRVIYPTREEYLRAISIALKLRKKGKPLPAIDVIIAAVALKRGLTVITKDAHFEIVREVEPELQLSIRK